MPAGARAAFMVVRSANRTVALLPMLRIGHRLQSLTTPYSCEYRPLFAAGLNQEIRVAAMAAFARACRSAGVVRLDALPADCEGLADLEAGARSVGLYTIRFDHFGNWHEDVEGLDWNAYLRRRPGALRETIRRRSRRAAALPDARFDLFTQPAEMDRATAAFQAVYRRSWKDPEPFPHFNTALIQAMAELGLVRLGVWSVGAEPVAVQLWVVKDRCAIVLKLAHDEAYKQHSPGTVLTAFMLQHLLDSDNVGRIDFGRGDDGYKQGWAVRRRQCIGLLLVNPLRLPGTGALLRHAIGRIRTLLRR
jgi:CelD/BcsL family acetyltransferase involved in cellulose biosynthesis